MIIRKSSSRARALRLGGSGDSVEVFPELLDTVLYGIPQKLTYSLSALPVKRRSLARIALLASPRVRDGLSWHTTCHELTPSNWDAVIRLMRPDYMLVESCLYDSRRSWNLAAFDAESYAQKMKALADAARKANVPSIFWYTLDVSMVDIFAEGMRAFDFVACADEVALERLKQLGISARSLLWAFSPEQFNPLTNFKLTVPPPFLLFDGATRMMRFGHIQNVLNAIHDLDLTIVDSGMLTSTYNIERCPNKDLASKIKGNISQTCIQEIYKQATAYLSIPDFPGRMTPAYVWRSLEAAACRVPVLHCDKEASSSFLSEFSEICASPEQVRELYHSLKTVPLEQERRGHMAWRTVHSRHTFAHRIDTLHQWLGIEKKAVETPRATIVTPSMRLENQKHALAQYRAQTWPNKDFFFVLNGDDVSQADVLLQEAQRDPDVHVAHVPREFSTGMVMNAGLNMADGDYVFKMDDDDMYGENYVADRMIYFREFDIKVMGTARSFFAFKGEDIAYSFDKMKLRQDKIVNSLGNVEYSLSSFSGATVAMQREYGRLVGYQEQAYAYADVSFLYKGIFFTPGCASLNMDILNFCVQRGNAAEHTWTISKKELLHMSLGNSIPLEKIFI